MKLIQLKVYELDVCTVCRRRTWSMLKWWSVKTCTLILCQASSWKVHCVTRDHRMIWRRRHWRRRQVLHQPSAHLILNQSHSTVELCAWQAASLMMLTAGHRKMMTLFRWQHVVLSVLLALTHCAVCCLRIDMNCKLWCGLTSLLCSPTDLCSHHHVVEFFEWLHWLSLIHQLL